ncbi:hypothetical protein QPK13_23085 [Photorhabdus tasmaniensis]
MTTMDSAHPLLQVVLNEEGHLSVPKHPGASQLCPTCLREVAISHEGHIMHIHEATFNACKPSISVVITKAIIERLNEGARIFVNPVKNGNKTLAPPIIFVHNNQPLKPFINTDYQPAGASWKSDKGFRLGLFFMEERASKIIS